MRTSSIHPALAGLVTLREIVRGLDSLGGRLLETPVREVMNAKPAAVVTPPSAIPLLAGRVFTIGFSWKQ